MAVRDSPGKREAVFLNGGVRERKNTQQRCRNISTAAKEAKVIIFYCDDSIALENKQFGYLWSTGLKQS